MRRIKLLSILFLSALVVSCVKEPQPIHVTGITLNSSTLELVEGETADLVATVSPKDADNQTIIWSSSSGSVASVNNGRVTAIKAGTASIIAKSDDGGYTASCSVTVSPRTIEVTSVTLSKTELSLIEGDSETITATVSPDNATDKTVTWTSSNTAVATVENGKITAIKEGSATITAKAGDKSATCVVKVEKKVIPVTSIALNKSELNLVKGSSETLVATVKPDDATDKTVIWSSSNTSVATVDQNGKVTAVNGGSATITAKAGDKSATCTVTVTIPVTSVALNKTKLTLTKGKAETLVATVNPSDATDKSVTWSSSNTAVATVDQNGKVSAIKEGTATITVSTNDGSKIATCDVTVTVPVESISLNIGELTLPIGESEVLTATVKPDDATDKTVIWNSIDPSVATVDANGKVTAIGIGETKIVAKAGDKSAECCVSVISVPVSSITLNHTDLKMKVGDTKMLTATVYPDNATDKTITWSSSDESIAVVSIGGLVTAINKGKASIFARSSQEGVFATCEVLIYDDDSNVEGGDMNYGSGEF